MLTNQLRRLHKFLVRRGATREHAEDLVQEAMLRLHAYTQGGGTVRNQDAFLTRTAMNLAVDAFRHARVDRFECNPVEELELVDLAPTPDEVFAAEQRLVQMRQVLERVNPRTSEIFFKHRLQGMSHAEIAGQLNISVSAVEKHVASAVMLLAMQRQRE